MSIAIADEPKFHVTFDAISQRAFEKWATRLECGADSDSLLNWLEAESELRQLRVLNIQTQRLQRRISRLLATSKREHLRLAAEHDVARILSMSSTLNEVAPQVLQRICEHFGYGVGALWRVDAAAAVLRCEAVFHVPTLNVSAFTEVTREQAFEIGVGLPGRAWANDSFILIPNAAEEFSLPRQQAAAAAGLHGAVAFPVKCDGEFLGVMEFFAAEVRKSSRANIAMMSSIVRQVGQYIGRGNAVTALLRLQEDRQIAGCIQQRLLPRSHPLIPGYEILGRCLSSTDVGGDCFDYMTSSIDGDEGLAVLLADASGHGIGAALLVAEARACINALCMTGLEMEPLLGLVNQRFAKDPDLEGFITAFLVRLAPRSGALRYANAGHCPGIIFASEGSVRKNLFATRLPLGVSTTAELFAGAVETLQPGELLLLYTDGATEVFSSSGDLFGTERLVRSVRAHWNASVEELLEGVIDDILRFSNGCGLRDDLTVVVIKRLPQVPDRSGDDLAGDCHRSELPGEGAASGDAQG